MTTSMSTGQIEMRRVLDVLAERVARIVESRRADGDVDDAQRGLYFPPALIIRDARVQPPEPDQLSHHEVPQRLKALAGSLALTELDQDILVIAASVSIQPRFEHFFIVLNNEVESRGPMVATALLLAGSDVDDPQARARFSAASPLRRLGLIELRQEDRPLLTRTLVVPDRVVDFLLGGDNVDPALLAVLAPAPSGLDEALLPSLADTPWPAVIRARSGCGWHEQVLRLGRRWTGRDALVVVGTQCESDQLLNLVRSGIREAALSGRALVIDVRGMSHDLRAICLRELTGCGLPGAVVVEPRSTTTDWSVVETRLALPSASQRRAWWQALGASSGEVQSADATTHLEPKDIVARLASRSTTGRRLGPMRQGLVQHITPAFTLGDLVLDDHARTELADLAGRVRFRGLVLDEWGMRPGGGRGRGVAALFTGPPGTGKSMAAEALAGDLGVSLFRVELATVVDKYIGETEKNLDQVFSAVENSDGVLLFDEADALFGKRSEVSDARDRYANIEVAYLLQRMEAFDGLAILTTNLRANLDPAFVRRLDAVVEFAEPESDERAKLWQSCLGDYPLALSVDDLQTLAAIPMAGGAIRAAVLTAAYLAAARGRAITASDLLEAGQREWRKMGRLAHPGIWTERTQL
jgi:hypothetical protein